MPAKKKAKDSASTPAKTATAAPTRCERGGDPIEPTAPLRAAVASRIDLRILICKANSRVRIYVDSELTATADGQDEVAYTMPALAPGLHLLYWSVMPQGEEWQTLAEVSVGGTVCFRRRRAQDANNPTGIGFVYVEVLP